MTVEERVLGHHIWDARLEKAVSDLSRYDASPDLVRENLVRFAKESISSLLKLPLNPPTEWTQESFHGFFNDEEANGHKGWIEVDDGEGYQLTLKAYDYESDAFIRGVQPNDHWNQRMDLAHLLHFLVTLCRVHEGEIPDGRGYENGPWNEVARQALLTNQ